jgi:hypothetical protein
MTDSLQAAQERDPPISMKRPCPDLAASEEEKDVFLALPGPAFSPLPILPSGAIDRIGDRIHPHRVKGFNF